MELSRPDARTSERDWLADRFQAYRPQLRALAYRMLGSLREADDAVQETWLRLDRSDAAAINDLRTWLSTVAGRVCLDMLRSRKASREYYAGSWLPEPMIGADPAEGPEQQAVLADSVGLALLVVLEALTPAERLAFVLHDVFDVPFEQIAPVVDRTPQAARQLASRARRRIQRAPVPDPDPGRQRRAVNAFLAAGPARGFRRAGRRPRPRCRLPRRPRPWQPASAPARRAPGRPARPRRRPPVRRPGQPRHHQRRGRRAVRQARRPDRGDRVHRGPRPDRRARPDLRPGQAGHYRLRAARPGRPGPCGPPSCRTFRAPRRRAGWRPSTGRRRAARYGTGSTGPWAGTTSAAGSRPRR